ncbi:MAG: IS21 family transposase [Bacteroidales bacterium]|nr:IS21 family transposase [Bacteroidales bacterium]
MEDYRNIRQMFLSGISQREIARKLQISRNTVAKYCKGDAVPWERKTPERESSVLTKEVVEFIKACLQEDRKEKISKQKHTAKRIFSRLVTEMEFTGGESTVRRKVSELKKTTPKVFVPLEFSPGEAMQVDWGEATVYLRGKKTKVYLFCARLCYSCAPIVFAFYRQNQESFLEAFVRAFCFFNGVPLKVIFDNAKIAVKDGFGANAVKQAKYSALSAHYGFEALFCNPEEAHEKGLVEGLVGWARRNILVPVPKVDSLNELNLLLAKRCLEYRGHHIRGKLGSVGEMFETEQKLLRALPGYEFETAKCSNVRVSLFSTVRFDSNDYSVPVSYCGANVSVKGHADHVDIYLKGKLIESHERCFKRKTAIYKLEHYLPILEYRKRAVFNAAPVRQNLPEEFLEWLKVTASNHKELMQLLRDCVEYGWENVWKNHRVSNPEPVVTDVIPILQVSLDKYDLLAKKGVDLSHAN